jgi:hypothetical protein
VRLPRTESDRLPGVRRRGYLAELGRGSQIQAQVRQLTEQEIEFLEAEANSSTDLKEFIPIHTVDPGYLSTAIPWRRTKGEKAYRLLSDAMQQTGRVAPAEMVSHNTEKPGRNPLGTRRVDPSV